MHSLRVREHPIEGPYVQGIKSLFSLKNQCVFLSFCNWQFMQFYLKKKTGITLDLFKLCQICPNMWSMTSLILKSWWTEEILSGTFFTKVWYQDIFLGWGGPISYNFSCWSPIGPVLSTFIFSVCWCIGLFEQNHCLHQHERCQ